MGYLEPGCYIDGHWGRYGTGRLIEIAVEFGWKDFEALALLANSPSSPPDFDDDSFAISLDAEDYLNSIAPEGFSFGWFEGEYFLWSQQDWEDNWGY